jgi:hypothetical protein
VPITIVAAGLPQIVGQTGRAKSCAERLFEFAAVDRLDEDAARAALRVPAEKADVSFDDNAIAEILQQTQRYPYFLQISVPVRIGRATSQNVSRKGHRRGTDPQRADREGNDLQPGTW